MVGSLRKGSINRKAANALIELAPSVLKLGIIEIGHLPIYNQDGDENPAGAEHKTVDAERTAAMQSLKRFVDPKDIAALVLFLISDARKSISGHVLPIDNDAQTSA